MRRFFKIFPGVVLFLAGLWFSHRPILEGRHLYVHGNLGDARYVNLMLEHNYSWLVKGWPESYWNPPWAFFPETGVTAFSDTLLSSAPLYIPLRMLGLSALSAFQVWFLVVSVLNFGAFFWFLRRLDVTHLGASVGAFLFSFSMPASVLLGHAQLHARFFIPLALVAFHAHLTASQALRRGLWLVAAAAIVGFQFWSSAYLGWFFVFALGVAALGFAMQPGVFNQMLPAVRRAPLWYACGACGFLLVTAPLAFQYRANAAVRSWEETLHYVASPGALLHAHPGAYLYHFLGATPLLEDGADVMFAGFLLLCMPVAFFVMMRRTKNGPGAGHSVGVASLVTALVLLVVSMRWGDFTLWKFVYDFLPGASGIRAVSRIALLILSAAAIPMAITLSRIERAGRQGFWVALVLSLGVVLENSHRNTEAYNKSRHVVRVERIKQQLALHGTCGAFYVEPAAGSVPLITHLDAMWVSMETQIPTVNGYSGSVPHGWTFEARAAEEDIERYLRTRGAHVEGKVCIVRQAAD